jgi:hypothetical protein
LKVGLVEFSLPQLLVNLSELGESEDWADECKRKVSLLKLVRRSLNCVIKDLGMVEGETQRTQGLVYWPFHCVGGIGSSAYVPEFGGHC